MSNVRPESLRHDFEAEFSHLNWEVDISPWKPLTGGSRMYALINQEALMGDRNSLQWRYKEQLVDGSDGSGLEWLCEVGYRHRFLRL